MENSNKKSRQGKTPQQIKDSEKLAWFGVVGMVILLILVMLLSSCSHKTHVITEGDGDREIRWYSTNKNNTDSIIPKGVSCECVECTTGNWGPTIKK
jgi:hypothetical protein